ncbi:hypothetical protein APA_258 [Pseudanabaena sp. lw0831]|nr:hypothetical protein APA_258 [Pseudanabaena sp. lw0831]
MYNQQEVCLETIAKNIRLFEFVRNTHKHHVSITCDRG